MVPHVATRIRYVCVHLGYWLSLVLPSPHATAWFLVCVIYVNNMTEQQQREFERAAQRAREYRNTNRAYAIRYGR